MGRLDTAGIVAVAAIAAVMGTTSSWAQPQPAPASLDWRRVGNSSVDLSLAGLASGPVDRVWYSANGSRLSIRTASGRIFETTDFETWTPAAESAEPGRPPAILASRIPETGADLRLAPGQGARAYAFGRFVYRSDDRGATWDNLTGFRSSSILGEGLRDLAVSPANPDEVTVVGTAGVFRSMDGGKSWSSMNERLPNLPVTKIRALPSGDRGARLELSGAAVVEWQPGEKQAWRLADSRDATTDLSLRRVLSQGRQGEVTAAVIRGDFVYTGMADGRIVVSSDSGRTWQTSLSQGGPVHAFWIDPQDPRVALAVLGARSAPAIPGVPPVHVLRTANGGTFWDNITSNLPDTAANGVVADKSTGAIYAATSKGVFVTRTDLIALGPANGWTALGGLPDAPAMDVQLDAGGNQLWVAVDGYGAYSTLAPHRLGDPRVVSAADFVARAAAPGSLVSVVGARVDSARAGDLSVPVLAATDTESQLQVPFDATGSILSLAIDSGGRRRIAPLPLEPTAPAVFVNQDGSPLLLDADSGTMLDAMHPAHSRTRIQVLATGLGRVTPEWPTGLPAPLENTPRVNAPVKAWLDRSPVEVTRAVLAPGYIGFYLVEIEIPKIVNYGPAELYIEAGSQASNRVRLYIEP